MNVNVILSNIRKHDLLKEPNDAHMVHMLLDTLKKSCDAHRCVGLIGIQEIARSILGLVVGVQKKYPF